MESTFLSVGLIHRIESEKNQFLVVKSSTENLWSPITGTRLEKESFRETIIREIGWALDLDRKKDFVVSNMAASSQEYVEENPDGPHHFAVAFYRTRLYTQPARQKVEDNPGACWISASELCSGSFEQEQRIETRIVDWINRWTVLNPWE